MGSKMSEATIKEVEELAMELANEAMNGISFQNSLVNKESLYRFSLLSMLTYLHYLKSKGYFVGEYR